MSARLVVFFLVSFFAVCGSLPLVAFYFIQISLVGLAANILAVPLVGFITVPLGLLAFFLAPLSATLAAWCLKAGAFALAGALDVIKFFSGLPLAAVKTFTPSMLEIICYYTLGWAILHLIRIPPAVNPGPSAPPVSSLNPKGGTLDDAVPAEAGNLRKFIRLGKGIGHRGGSSRKWAQIVAILTLFILGADSCYWLYQRF